MTPRPGSTYPRSRDEPLDSALYDMFMELIHVNSAATALDDEDAREATGHSMRPQALPIEDESSQSVQRARK